VSNGEKPGTQDIEAAHDVTIPRQKIKKEPTYNHNGHLVTRGIHPDGESGRSGIHPWHFVKVCYKSSSHVSRYINFLWPVVPAAIAVYYTHNDASRWIFALNYIAMVPTANLIGFAGQELARKLPKVFGECIREIFQWYIETHDVHI
jgi:Ca2+:H+ antiporter